MRLSFRPPLWSWFATLPMLVLLCGLGRWQVQRGMDKAALETQFETAAQSEPLLLEEKMDPPRTELRLEVRGRYDTAHQLLLDNQTYRRQPGYHVLTPLRLDDGRLLLVNRGWIVASPDRKLPAEPPATSGEQRVVGMWRGLPVPGLRLAVDNCAGEAWPRVVEYPTARDLDCLLGEPVMRGLLLLDADQPDGFVREWSIAAQFPPSRHYAYAAQWFALALTLLTIFIKLNFKRTA